MYDEDKTQNFYRDFYIENRVAILQYRNLRKNFNEMVSKVLGKYYYNIAMDVYEADRIACEDIERKANKTILQRIFNIS